MSGIKYDRDKVRMELLSVCALQEIAKVLTVGAQKYTSHNWRQGFAWSRLHGALLRHVTAHMSGEDRDPETGYSHLAHAGCCLMFLLEHEIRGLGTDDRYRETIVAPTAPAESPSRTLELTRNYLAELAGLGQKLEQRDAPLQGDQMIDLFAPPLVRESVQGLYQSLGINDTDGLGLTVDNPIRETVG